MSAKKESEENPMVPARRGIHPMLAWPAIYALAVFVAAWLYHFTGRDAFSPWFLLGVLPVLGMAGSAAARAVWDDARYGPRQGDDGATLAWATAVVTAAWLTWSGHVGPDRASSMWALVVLLLCAWWWALGLRAPKRAAAAVALSERLEAAAVDREWREILDQAGVGDVLITGKREHRAGFTFTCEPDPEAKRMPTYDDFRGAVPGIAVRAASRARRRGTPLPMGAVRTEPGADDAEFLLHVTTRDVFAAATEYVPDYVPGDITKALDVGEYEDAARILMDLLGGHWKIVGAEGSGKALDVDTPIPTPDGWTTMGQLQDGDRVFDEAGAVCRVVRAHAVMHDRPCYEVEFSDGSVIVADEDHRWFTETLAERRALSRRRASAPERRERISSDAAAGLRAWAVEHPTATRQEVVAAVRVATAGAYEGLVMVGRIAAGMTPAGRTTRTFDQQYGDRVVTKTRPVDTFDTADLVGRLLERVAQSYQDQSHLYTGGGAVRTTGQILATLRDGGRANHSVVVAQPLDLPDRPLPIAPYTLGACLGDGTHRSGRITSADADLFDRIADDGYRVGPDVSGGRSGRATTRQVEGLTSALRDLGLLYVLESGRPCEHCGEEYAATSGRQRFCPTCCPDHAARARLMRQHPTRAYVGKRDWAPPPDKRIPAEYLRAGVRQRRALLTGLLDTDGTVSRQGQIQFTVTAEGLARDVLELASSLGYRATFRSRPAKMNGVRYGTAYMVAWTTDDPVFRVERKAQMMKERARGDGTKTRAWMIVDVRPVASRPVRCITVDSPSALYLAGPTMIPTHNTNYANNIIGRSTACSNALVWACATDKLIPLIFPWVRTFFDGSAPLPALDWVAGTDPAAVRRLLRAAYRLACERNARLADVSKMKATAREPAVIVCLEEASHAFEFTDTIRTHDGQDVTVTDLVKMILQAGRSANVRMVLLTQYGINAGLGDRASEMMRNLRGRVCLRTMEDYDGMRTLPALPSSIRTTELTNYTMYLQPSIDVPRVSPGKAAFLEGTAMIAPVAIRNAGWRPTGVEAESADVLGPDYAARWDRAAHPELARAVAQAGLQWRVPGEEPVPAEPVAGVAVDPIAAGETGQVARDGGVDVDTTQQWTDADDAAFRALLPEPEAPKPFQLPDLGPALKRLKRHFDPARPVVEPPPEGGDDAAAEVVDYRAAGPLPEPLDAIVEWLELAATQGLAVPEWLRTEELAAGIGWTQGTAKLGRMLAGLGLESDHLPRGIDPQRRRGYPVALIQEVAARHRFGL